MPCYEFHLFPLFLLNAVGCFIILSLPTLPSPRFLLLFALLGFPLGCAGFFLPRFPACFPLAFCLTFVLGGHTPRSPPSPLVASQRFVDRAVTVNSKRYSAAVRRTGRDNIEGPLLHLSSCCYYSPGVTRGTVTLRSKLLRHDIVSHVFEYCVSARRVDSKR